MAKLYVTEFSSLAQAGAQAGPGALTNGPIVATPPVVDQTPVAIGVAAQSAAFNDATKIVRIHTDAICSIAFGKNPTASVNTMRLAAGQTEYFGVIPGEKVSVIANT